LRFAGDWHALDIGTAALDRCHTARG
jgi:hypothetical protein